MNIDNPTPAEILTFWRQAGRDRWYEKDSDFDAEVRRRFLETWRNAAAGVMSSWEASDDSALALTIVLDQFPRNMFRGTSQAYTSDAMARDVAGRALARGVDTRIEPGLREFLYLPLMHSEDLSHQLRGVEFFRNLPESLKFAERHADIIRRFGRFPHRNAVLGRATTPEEQAFLDAGGFSG
jgi:uncharacterized protein (DUF924 family)